MQLLHSFYYLDLRIESHHMPGAVGQSQSKLNGDSYLKACTLADISCQPIAFSNRVKDAAKDGLMYARNSSHFSFGTKPSLGTSIDGSSKKV